MAVEIKVPALGESVTEAVLLKWSIHGSAGTPGGALAGHGDADLSHRQQAAKNLPWKATGGHIGPPGPVSLAGVYKPHRRMPAVVSVPR